MEQTQTKKRDRRGTTWRILLAVLLTLELITGVILSARLVNFTTFRHNYFALVGGSASRRVMDAYDQPAEGQDVVRSGAQVWTNGADIELFHIRYDNNGDLVYTVESGRGDKVLAPGTENAYTFTVGNPTTEQVDYTLTMGAWQEGAEEMPIPLTFRVYDDLGRYQAGSADQGAAPDALNDICFWESLKGGATRTYTIQWEWPYEYGASDDLGEADAYDTALGNRAVQEDIIQHVTISTQADVYQVGEAERAWWGGASWALVNLICMILTDALAVVEVLKFIFGRKQKKEDEEAKKAAAAAAETGAVPAAAAAGAAAAAVKPAEDEEDEKERKRMGWKLFQIVPYVFGTVLFHVTENMRLPMVWVDKYTILMVVTLLVGITLAFLTRQRDPEEDEEEPEQENAPEEAAKE